MSQHICHTLAIPLWGCQTPVCEHPAPLVPKPLHRRRCVYYTWLPRFRASFLPSDEMLGRPNQLPGQGSCYLMGRPWASNADRLPKLLSEITDNDRVRARGCACVRACGRAGVHPCGHGAVFGPCDDCWHARTMIISLMRQATTAPAGVLP